MADVRKPYPTKARERIQAGMIMDRLHKCVEGQIEMTATQVNAARILLNKVVPDQTASKVESTVKVTDDTTPDKNDKEWASATLHAINGGKSE